MRTSLRLAFAVAASCLPLVAGCGEPGAVNDGGTLRDAVAPTDDLQSGSPGPLNPGFESGMSPWVVGSTCPSRFGAVGPKVVTGLSFMPTSGTQYLLFDTQPCDATGSGMSVYQDHVDLTGDHELAFDFLIEGTGNAALCKNMHLDASILYTSSGTVTLWHRTVESLDHLETIAQTVVLPSLPASGRVTIKIDFSGGCIPGSINICPCAQWKFAVDNLRVN